MGIIYSKNNSWDEISKYEINAKNNNFAAITIKRLRCIVTTAYQIGVVQVKEGEIHKKFFSYFQPCNTMSKATIKFVPEDILNNIYNAPTFNVVWDKIIDMFDDHVIITSDIHPDFSMLTYLMDFYNIDFTPLINIPTDSPQSIAMKSLIDKNRPLETENALWYAEQVVSNYLNKDMSNEEFEKRLLRKKILGY